MAKSLTAKYYIKKHAAKSKRAEKKITQKNPSAETPTDRKIAKSPK